MRRSIAIVIIVVAGVVACVVSVLARYALGRLLGSDWWWLF